METVPVQLAQNSYEIAIAAGGLSGLGEWMQGVGVGTKALLVSNPEIFEHYGEVAIASLQAAGFEVATHLLSAGEKYKTLESIQQLYDTALQQRMERSSVFVALGGGVVGDMTGFAAATWLRGVAVVQVPTTLLAMVDAAIGGKTGVNHPQGKNLIGAFHQPRGVFIDPEVLRTLPQREFRAGMAEVIKYGVIWDKLLFEALEKAASLDSYDGVEADLLQEILIRSARAKAEVVAKDEKEGGLRAILNYGHTVGHAVESLTNYTSLVHGEAVAIGMVVAGDLAVELGLWDKMSAQRQNELMIKAGLPTAIPGSVKVEDILASVQTDKKVKAGKVRFILPTEIGVATISDRVSSELLEAVLVRHFEREKQDTLVG